MSGEDANDHEDDMYRYYAEMKDRTPKEDVSVEGGRGKA
jgi:hypothetical protein